MKLRTGFLAWIATALVVSSLVFGALFVVLYRTQVEQERRQSLTEINRLLQSSLEHAMLRSDLDALRDILGRLGSQAGVRAAFIVDPQREIRFASDPELLGKRVEPSELGLAGTTAGAPVRTMEPASIMLDDALGGILRGVHPVRNQPQCARCHGAPEQRPINGILVVDYDAQPLRAAALKSALMFACAGVVVLIVTLGSGGWFMQRKVLLPVRRLEHASRDLAEGRLDVRVERSSDDELGRLATTFNTMAANVHGALAEVRRKEEFLQQLIDAIPDGIRVIDDRFNVRLVNEAFLSMHGLARDSALGRKCYEGSHRRREPCPASFETCPMHEIRSTGRAIRSVTRHVRGTEARPLNVEVFAAPLPATNGDAPTTWIVEAIRDLDADIRYSHEQRLSEVGRLATGVAHEIYNPLAAIRIALQGAGRSMAGGRTDVREITEYLTMVDSQIDRCVEVTERLLKLGMPPGKSQLVDVNQTLRETLQLLAWEAADAGVTVVEELSPHGPRVLVSDSDLRMVALNLIQNAFHAMPEGGRLVVRTGIVDGRVTMIFTDTGIGIPASDRQRIFEPFFSRRADGKRGTGLGLAICRGLLLGYGGSLEVTSEVGAGSRFCATLPVADAETRAEAASEVPAA
ncbi:MAG: HAMP domain-containing protein [Betaproteobacteria bacterium]|nr:HAMP domain-containing protein [Betaproteobacteria bacterium]